MLAQNCMKLVTRTSFVSGSSRIMAFNCPPELLLRNARKSTAAVVVRQVSSGPPTTYRASVVTELGKPMELENMEIGSHVPDGFVLVDIHNAAVNFGDLLMAQGKYQEKPPLPFTPGTEFAGVIRGVGKGVNNWKQGDRVFGLSGPMAGTHAEKALVPANRIFNVPVKMSTEIACSILVVYATSFMALDHRARIKPGDTVLVTSAAGGVGLSSVDLAANYFQANVIGACSTDEKCKVAESRGASTTINYTKESVSKRVKEVTNGKGADIIIDNVGGDMFKECLKSVAFEGRIVVIGFTSGEIPKIPANLLLLKSCTVMGVYWGNYSQRHPVAFQESIQGILRAYDAGKMNPHISKVFPLGQANEAFKFIQDRKSTGKVVLDCRT